MLYDMKLTRAQVVALAAWVDSGAGMAPVLLGSDRTGGDSIRAGQGDDRCTIYANGGLSED